VLLVVLLLLLVDVLGRGVAEVGRIHGRWMRRGIGGAVVHHGGGVVIARVMAARARVEA
jgi:hypothetical protein